MNINDILSNNNINTTSSVKNQVTSTTSPPQYASESTNKINKEVDLSFLRYALQPKAYHHFQALPPQLKKNLKELEIIKGNLKHLASGGSLQDQMKLKQFGNQQIYPKPLKFTEEPVKNTPPKKRYIQLANQEKLMDKPSKNIPKWRREAMQPVLEEKQSAFKKYPEVQPKPNDLNSVSGQFNSWVGNGHITGANMQQLPPYSLPYQPPFFNNQYPPTSSNVYIPDLYEPSTMHPPPFQFQQPLEGQYNPWDYSSPALFPAQLPPQYYPWFDPNLPMVPNFTASQNPFPFQQMTSDQFKSNGSTERIPEPFHFKMMGNNFNDPTKQDEPVVRTPQLPQHSQVPQQPHLPQHSQVSRQSQVPQQPHLPQHPQVPQQPQHPQVPQQPQHPQVPQQSQVPIRQDKSIEKISQLLQSKLSGNQGAVGQIPQTNVPQIPISDSLKPERIPQISNNSPIKQDKSTKEKQQEYAVGSKRQYNKCVKELVSHVEILGNKLKNSENQRKYMSVVMTELIKEYIKTQNYARLPDRQNRAFPPEPPQMIRNLLKPYENYISKYGENIITPEPSPPVNENQDTNNNQPFHENQIKDNNQSFNENQSKDNQSLNENSSTTIENDKMPLKFKFSFTGVTEDGKRNYSLLQDDEGDDAPVSKKPCENNMPIVESTEKNAGQDTSDDEDALYIDEDYNVDI